MKIRTAAARVGLAALALALALVAGAEWTAACGVAIGGNTALWAQQAETAGLVLEQAHGLWPVRREAAYERARLALAAGDFDVAAAWLALSDGRVASRVRWLRVAANVSHGLGQPGDEEAALTEALMLHPNHPDNWLALAELRDDPNAARAARLRAGVW